jgi:uncharacterized protein with NAD-binding domain and iron-sulfur cluster
MAKRRIAILGGGMGSLSAAFELTDPANPAAKDLEITVYTRGWRLGGKGASGRNMSGPEGVRGRIEEHGLHVWFGFYENAFNQVRRCYAELARPAGAPLARWDDAFKPHDFIVSEERVNGGWSHWPATFPRREGTPGDGTPFGLVDYLLAPLAWLRDAWREVLELDPSAFDPMATSPARASHWWDRLLERVRGEVEDAVEVPARHLLDHALELARKLPPSLSKAAGGELEVIHSCVGVFLDTIRPIAARSDAVRRFLLLADVAGAVVRGVIKDEVLLPTGGFDRLDALDFGDWLIRHGAPSSIRDSAFLRGSYDTVFGFRQGDPARETLAAGTGLKSGVRMFLGYKGACMWFMQAGMGDVVFAPLYQVLKRRGVRFEFFHRVVELELSADQQALAAVKLRKQVHTKKPEYEPLFSLNGLPCWPSEPLYDQLVEGESLELRRRRGENVDLESTWTAWADVEELTLQQGRDFDVAVLGIPIGALPPICGALIAASPRWAAMVHKVETMRTMGVQLWLTPSLKQLGWDDPIPVVGSYVRPLSTWADLTHLLEREAWPASNRPGHLAYLCGPMRDTDEPPPFTDPTYPARETETVRRTAREFLEKCASHLWPIDPQKPRPFDPALLADLSGAATWDRLAAQYFRANVDPSERYTLSVPGSTEHRLRANESGFANLVLAGDWIRTGLNAGCIEAAAMSGMQASRAITSHPHSVFGEADSW